MREDISENVLRTTDEGILFTVHIPDAVDVIEKAGEDPEATRPIAGFCSTDELDRQGEVVVAKGLDFSEFVNHGWFNDNHKQETAATLGWPRDARLEKASDGRMKWWTEGNLIPGYPPSDQIWLLAKALHRSSSPRKLGFSIEGKVLERDHNNKILRALIRNVAITNCFPGSVRVRGPAESVTRRWYSGPLVEIVLATGEHLSGTPNHPIFTDRGWVALGDLDERHHRVGRRDRDFVANFGGASYVPLSVSQAVVSHDVEDVPPSLGEVFDAACDSGHCRGVRPVRKPEFHGDGVSGGYVDIVDVDSLLKRCLDIAFVQKFGEDTLSASDEQPSLFSGFGSGAASFPRVLPSFGRFALPRQSLLSLGGGFVDKADALPFAYASMNSESFGDQPYSFTGNTITGCDRGRLLSRAVGFSNIVRKSVIGFSGHVFNLQSTKGWYEANGIVAHNCPVNVGCRWGVMIKSFAPAEAVERAAEKALSAGHQSPRTSGGGVQRIESLEGAAVLTRGQAFSIAKKRFPNLSDHAIRRVIRYAQGVA